MEVLTVLQAIWEFILAASGITAVLVILVNLGKKIEIKGVPIVKDGDGEKWFKSLQLVVFAGLVALKLAYPELTLSLIENFALDLADTYGAVLAILLPFSGRLAKFLYDTGLKDIPLIGASHSSKPAK